MKRFPYLLQKKVVLPRKIVILINFQKEKEKQSLERQEKKENLR
jgi:hypothetical protein